jgi:hypothetical protein
MAATTPAPLCTTILPNGKRCGSFALRGKRICYHHSGVRSSSARDRRLARRMDQLNSQFDRMGTADLLVHLHKQLSTLPKTLSRFPEVSFALVYTLTRLEEISSLESRIPKLAQRNQKVARRLKPAPALSGTYIHAPAESEICTQFPELPQLNQ